MLRVTCEHLLIRTNLTYYIYPSEDVLLLIYYGNEFYLCEIIIWVPSFISWYLVLCDNCSLLRAIHILYFSCSACCYIFWGEHHLKTGVPRRPRCLICICSIAERRWKSTPHACLEENTTWESRTWWLTLRRSGSTSTFQSGRQLQIHLLLSTATYTLL